MRVICMYCKKEIGEKEPLSDPDISHGICDECMEARYQGGKKVGNRIFSENTMRVKCKKWYERGEIIQLRQCEIRQEEVFGDGFLSCENCKERKIK